MDGVAAAISVMVARSETGHSGGDGGCGRVSGRSGTVGRQATAGGFVKKEHLTTVGGQ